MDDDQSSTRVVMLGVCVCASRWAECKQLHDKIRLHLLFIVGVSVCVCVFFYDHHHI